VRNRLGLASGLALAYSLALLGDQMLYVFLPSQPAAAGVAAASLGIILSANRFVRLAANSLAGLLSDRLGRRRPYLLGMLLALVSTAGYLVSDGFWSLLLSRVVWGIAFALIHVVGTAVILDVSTDEDRGRTVGSYSSLAQLGTLIGLVLSGFLTDLMGYRGTLMIYVPLAGLGILVALLVLRDRDGEPMRRPAAASGGLGTLAALRGLDRRLLAPAYVNFVSLFAGSGVVAATLGFYLKQMAASEPGAGFLVPIASLTGILLAARRLAGMIEAPIAGQLLDRFGDRRAVAALGALVSLVGFAVLAGARGVGMVVLGVVLMAIGEGFIGPAVVVWTGDNAPPHLRGVVMGGLATTGDLGAAIGPLVGYALLETAGLRPAYALCVALMLSALLVLAFVRRYSGSTPRPSPTRLA
jgi:DHA1 family multidrug resistance protein-like MFS transporter